MLVVACEVRGVVRLRISSFLSQPSSLREMTVGCCYCCLMKMSKRKQHILCQMHTYTNTHRGTETHTHREKPWWSVEWREAENVFHCWLYQQTFLGAARDKIIVLSYTNSCTDISCFNIFLLVFSHRPFSCSFPQPTLHYAGRCTHLSTQLQASAKLPASVSPFLESYSLSLIIEADNTTLSVSFSL